MTVQATLGSDEGQTQQKQQQQQQNNNQGYNDMYDL